MKRYIIGGNRISKHTDTKEQLTAVQSIAKQIMSSHGFDVSSWSFIDEFDGGYGKCGLHWNTPFGKASTILDLDQYNQKGQVICRFSISFIEEFDHPFFVSEHDTTWESVANEFLK